VIPTSLLQNAIAEVAVGSPYSEDQFRQFLDGAIRPLYDARGRIRVTFPSVTIAKAKDVEGLAVKVTVEEGASYDLGNVRIEGAADFSSADLLKAGKFKSGDLANFDDVGAGLDRMKTKMAHEGFMHSEIKILRHIDDEKKTVDLVLRVNEGPQYKFGTLKIEGLDLNGEAAIRKMWNLKQGKPYEPEYPNYFLGVVRDEGMFDNLGETRAEPNINDEAHTVDVTLYFKYGAPKPKKETRRPF
jgi:outer membrane protein insertion porin family